MTTRRKHIPALNPLELEAALARLEKTNLSPRGKALIRQMLTAASNPNNESPEVVMQTLEPERRREVERVMVEVSGVMRGVMNRGGAGLLAISDEEWERLVES